MLEDSQGSRLFGNIRTVEDFYIQVSMIAGKRTKEKDDTLIFIDEIQVYPHLLTMLKFLRDDDRFTYIASGSLLGVALSMTSSIPIGSIMAIHMYPLDFEEFLLANGFSRLAIDAIREKLRQHKSLDETAHARIMDLFRKYLIVGGLPQVVNAYLERKNIVEVRRIQKEIWKYYSLGA